jgi:ParB/RepB/Spo0J family partition protein
VSQAQLIPDTPEVGEQLLVSTERLPDDVYLVGPKPSCAMVESVKRFGVLQPVLLIENGEGFKVYDGRRRVKAAREAGLEEVPAIVYPPTVTGHVLTVVANTHRSENPLADIRAIEEMLAAGKTHEEIREATGMDKVRYERRLRLLGLHPDLRHEFESGRMALGVAETAAKLPGHMQKELAEIEGLITAQAVREVRSVGAVNATQALDPALFAPVVPIPQETPDRLKEAARRVLQLFPAEQQVARMTPERIAALQALALEVGNV